MDEGASAGDSELPRQLRKNRAFNIFWLGQGLSLLGGSMTLLALPILILDATGSIAQMGALTAVSAAFGIGAGTFAGHIVDRMDRRNTMIFSEVARAVALGLVPLIWLIEPQIWLLYVVTAVASVLKTVFDVAYVTAVPNLVDADDLTAANSRLQGTYAVAGILGPVLAGIIAAGVGPAWALGVNGATFLVSAVTLVFVRLRRTDELNGATEDDPRGPVRDNFLVGFTFLWNHSAMRALTFLLTALTFLTLGATDLLIFRVQQDLEQGADVLGYVIAVSGLGSIVAAVLASVLRRVVGFGACWLASVLLIGAAVALIGNSRNLVIIALMSAVFMFGITLAGILSMTLRQQVTPDHLLGRVTAAFWTVHNASGPVGAAVVTVGAARLGVPSVSLMGGLFCLVIFLVGIFTPLRVARPELIPPKSPSKPGSVPAPGPAKPSLEKDR
ncbi:MULTISPECIES: MFS transporter [Streptomyces]|uniref:MFS transporter n=1 Tax=Streptomyces parvus TaxID=66428 RepID=A0A5D4JIR3_9ACTN|nr:MULTISPECIES: MFS transporter [Streptomyces]PVC80833.1 MFS transporter [Streptomyces sp. CS014]TYR65172.1 MFS transporter [Streptomyces parvus]